MIDVSRLVLVTFVLLLIPADSCAQRPSAVQSLEGRLEERNLAAFWARNLKQGDRLDIHAAGTSGSLDPLVAVTDARLSIEQLIDEFEAARNRAVRDQRDVHEVFGEVASRLFLASDDDSGPGYSAKVALALPHDGDYRIILTGGLGLFALGNTARVTQGAYRLTVGLNTAVTAYTQERGASFLELDVAHLRTVSIQRLSGETTVDRPSVQYHLHTLHTGDTLSAWIGAPGGKAPRLRLLDFGGKELGLVNPHADQPAAELSYEATEDTAGLLLSIEGDGSQTQTYDLLLGRNAPEVHTGKAEPRGQPIVRPPIAVHVGVELDQITRVNQKEENFAVVAAVRMRWRDPAYAFSPDSCECRRRIFDEAGFLRFLDERNLRWPQFVIANQQGPRWAQEQIFVVKADGAAEYFERFTTTLQAPEFNFRLFPLDRQAFYVRLQSLFPPERYVYVADEDLSALGRKLGEEEWIVTEFHTSVDNWGDTPRFSYRFEATRHIFYYVLRLFIPIGLIVLIAWFSFMVRDYSKRVDISGANLLLFIAFNFTISSDLPRLGYMTFMDTLLIVTFVVSAILVVFNIYLRRLEGSDLDRVVWMDRWAARLYPFAYVVPLLAIYLGRVRPSG